MTDDLGFPETVAALAEFVGERVQVTIGVRLGDEGDESVVAMVPGQLRFAGDVDRQRVGSREPAPIAFAIYAGQESGQAPSLVINPGSFAFGAAVPDVVSWKASDHVVVMVGRLNAEGSR